jgi:hypothetical protein
VIGFGIGKKTKENKIPKVMRGYILPYISNFLPFTMALLCQKTGFVPIYKINFCIGWFKMCGA